MELKVIARLPDSNLVFGEDVVALILRRDKLLTAINTSDNRGIVKVWSSDFQLIYQLHAHEHPIYHMASGSESEFFTSASDSLIKHWNYENEECILLDILQGHKEPAWRLRYSGNRLYSGDSTGEVRMWENGEMVGCLGTVEDIWDMIVHDNLLYTTRHLDVYMTEFKIHDERIIWSIKNTIAGTGPLFIDGKKLCLMSRQTYEIQVHSLAESGNPLVGKLSGHEAIITSIVGDSKIIYSGAYDGKVIAWNLDSLTKISDIKPQGYINCMIFDPKNEIIYVGGENRLCALKLTLTT